MNNLPEPFRTELGLIGTKGEFHKRPSALNTKTASKLLKKRMYLTSSAFSKSWWEACKASVHRAHSLAKEVMTQMMTSTDQIVAESVSIVPNTWENINFVSVGTVNVPLVIIAFVATKVEALLEARAGRKKTHNKSYNITWVAHVDRVEELFTSDSLSFTDQVIIPAKMSAASHSVLEALKRTEVKEGETSEESDN